MNLTEEWLRANCRGVDGDIDEILGEPKPKAPVQRSQKPRLPPESIAVGGPWVLVLEDWLPPGVNHLLRVHWSRRARIKQGVADSLAIELLKAGVPDATGRRKVGMVIQVPNLSRAPDPDNVYKTVLDGLKTCRALIDDRQEWCLSTMPEIVKGPKRTTIVLEDLP